MTAFTFSATQSSLRNFSIITSFAVKQFIVLFAYAFTSLTLVAQTGGSLYSTIGLGELKYFPSSQSAAMGYTGVALESPYYINRINPAMLSSIEITRLTGNLIYTGYSAKNDFASAFQSTISLSNIALAIPIAGTTFSTGIYPYSRLEYSQTQSGTQSIEGGATSYTFRYDGKGGLYAIPIALGFAPYSNAKYGTLRLGFSVNVLFGTYETKRENIFTDVNTSNSNSEITSRVSGNTFTLGGAYQKKNIFSTSDQISFGASWTCARILNASSESIYRTGSVSDTIDLNDGSVSIPSSLTLGLAYSGNDTYTIAADIALQDWSSFSSALSTASEVQSYSRKSVRYGLGGEFVPSKNQISSFAARTIYRGGIYYHQTNLQFQGYGGINELGFTLGIGLPISQEFSRVDIGIEYAMRGTTEQSLIKENIFRVNLSLNAGTRWFLKRKID